MRGLVLLIVNDVPPEYLPVINELYFMAPKHISLPTLHSKDLHFYNKDKYVNTLAVLTSRQESRRPNPYLWLW